MFPKVRVTRLRFPMAAVLSLYIGCEAQKTLEPVRQGGIAPGSSGAISGIVSAALADDVVVRVVDQRGNPMRGAPVTWSASDGTITPSSTTDDNGNARARWTLGPTLGQQTATAKTASFSTQITATATGIWKSIEVAYTNACGLTKSNTPLCWGTNEAGQLGTGTAGAPGSVLIPTAVTTSQKFQDMRISYAHVCGIASSGTSYCWGLNSYGQLGVSNSTTPTCPTANARCTATVTPVGGSTAFTSLTTGFYHTCGLSGGKAYCWGRNTEGQLGIGTSDFVEHPTPAPVAGGLTFASISAGFAYTCGVTTANQGYCWGDNSYGELGTGSRTLVATPTPVAGNVAFTTISAGSAFTTCAIATGSQATYCWGLNDVGQLGNGVTDSLSLVPSRVGGTQVFASVRPSNFHTCALTAAGVAYCWGANSDGELGVGPQVSLNVCGASLTRCSRTPLPVAGGYTFTGLSANNFNTCGVTTLGGAFCWGLNDAGQIGNGTTTKSDVPVSVSNPKGIPLP